MGIVLSNEAHLCKCLGPCMYWDQITKPLIFCQRTYQPHVGTLNVKSRPPLGPIRIIVYDRGHSMPCVHGSHAHSVFMFDFNSSCPSSPGTSTANYYGHTSEPVMPRPSYTAIPVRAMIGIWHSQVVPSNILWNITDTVHMNKWELCDGIVLKTL